MPPSPKSPTHDDSILGSLKRAVSPFRQPESLEARPSVYRSLSISTPTSLRSRSNSSSSSVPPITPNEAVPIPPPKPYHYTKRHSTYSLVPEKNTVSYPRPPDVTKDMSMTTKRQPELIRVKENKDTTPSRAISHSDPDLSQAQRQRQRQRDDASSGAAANAHPIIRDLEPQSHTRPKDHAPVKEHTKGEPLHTYFHLTFPTGCWGSMLTCEFFSASFRRRGDINPVASHDRAITSQGITPTNHLHVFQG